MFSRLSCCGGQPCTQPSVICFIFRAPCVPNRETSRDFLALGRLNPRFGDSSHFCTAALSAEAPMLLHLRGLSRCSCEETSARAESHLANKTCKVPCNRSTPYYISNHKRHAASVERPKMLGNHATDLQTVVQTDGKHVLLPANDESANGRLRGDLIECHASNGFARLSDSKLFIYFFCAYLPS
jgi:hypothetical protein